MNRKPTVLIANGIMNAGGTESLLMEIFRHQSGCVHYVLLIHHQGKIEHGLYDDEIKRLGITIKYIPSVGSIGISKYVREFRDIVKEIGPVDILHSHLNGNGGIIAMAAKRAGIRKRICHCHADIHFTGSLAHRIKENLFLAILKGFIEIYATDYWACSESAWKRLFMPWRKKTIISNMIDPRKYMSNGEREGRLDQIAAQKGKVVIGSVGRVAPIKNYEFIIGLLRYLPHAQFVCYGRFDAENDYCKSLLNLAESIGVSDRVFFKGNSADIPAVLKTFDIFVMPSYTEGFGIAALESQAASLPTFVSEGVPDGIDVGLGLVRFLSLDRQQLWADEIKKIIKDKPKSICKADIIDAFRKHERDSVSGVVTIEKKYMSL